MKQRIQPYCWLIIGAGLFFAAGVLLFGFRLISLNQTSGAPVEPLVDSGESGLLGSWFAGADFIDLSADQNLTGILISAGNNKVSLLDQEKRLRWEKSFPTEPLQAKLSPCGNYLAVGTSCGQLFFMSTDQNLWWEVDTDTQINHLAISENGLWVVISRGDPEQEEHHLELYNQEGKLQWSIVTAPVTKLFLNGEHLEQGKIFYSQLYDGTETTAAITMEGVPVWEHEGETLLTISGSGNRLAATRGDRLFIYDYLGRLLWERLLFPIESAIFNPQNHSLLLYGKRNGGEPNLFYLNSNGEMLWQQSVAESSLFAFTADGRYLVTSSWRHYKDDYSQMILIDEGGGEVQRWDVAMGVEYLLVSGNRRFIVLGGEDGYIEIIDLDQLHQGENKIASAGPIYSPYTTHSNLVTLYFSDGDYLVPVSRSFGQTENRIRAAVEGLIRGPARDSFLYRTFPQDARIDLQFLEETGRLFLNMTPELAAPVASTQSINPLDSLRLTLSGFPEIKEIYLTVNGEVIDTFGDDLVLEQPLLQHLWQDPVFIPVRVGERYYLVPREARFLEIEQRNLNGLLQAALRISRTFYFTPSDLELLGVYEEAGVVTIDLSNAFKLLFPETGDEEDRLHTALLLDALFLTALENSGAGRIAITVEGESWTPPDGYPELNRTFFTPYFLNPE